MRASEASLARKHKFAIKRRAHDQGTSSGLVAAKIDQGANALPETTQGAAGRSNIMARGSGKYRSPSPRGYAFDLQSMAGLTLGEVGRRLLAATWNGASMLSLQLNQVWQVPVVAERKVFQKDLMPFPLPWFTDDEQRAAEAGVVPSSCGDVQEWDRRVWLVLVIHSLNSLHEGRNKRFKEAAAECCRLGEPQAAQRKALKLLKEYVAHFLRDGKVPVANWPRDLKKLRMSYNGEEVKTAQVLTMAQIQEGLPPKGAAASIRAADLAEDPLRSYLLDPRRALLPRESWPRPVPKGKVFADDHEWSKIVRYCVELGVFGLLKREEVFHVDGEPLLNGAFGVSKNKTVTGDKEKREVLRLIINLIPMNSLMRTLEGDIRTLPYGGQWSGIMLLGEDLVAVFSEEDLTCAFYLFEKKEWMPFQALNKTVTGADMKGVPGVSDELIKEAELFPAVAVLAMGDASASGILQYLHRRLVGQFSPSSANLPSNREVRKDRVLPQPWASETDKRPLKDGSSRFWSIYSDGYLETEMIHLDDLAFFKESSDWQNAVRKAYAHHGVLRALDKSKTCEVTIDRLGYYLDGAFGAASTPTKFDLSLIGLTVYCLMEKKCSTKLLQILAGRWNRKFQMRREVAMVFRSFYRCLTAEDKSISFEGQAELMMAMSLMPIMLTDFRLVLSQMVTASDASTTGMAVVRSGGLTAEGKAALAEMRCSATEAAGEHVGLVNLFGGVGAARRALELIGIEPGVHVHIESCPTAAAIVKREWPAAFQHVTAETVDEQDVKNWVAAGPHISVWIVFGSFTSQAITDSSFSDVTGLHRQFDRITALVRGASGKITFAGREEVSSMYTEAKTFFNKAFNCKAHELCPSDITHVRRPRLFWLDWQLRPSTCVQMEDKHDFVKVTLLGERHRSEGWVDPGWRLYDGETSALPAIITPQTRAQPPAYAAGIDQCDDDALSRWKADSYRYPPSHYLLSAGLIDAKFTKWRPLSIREKELLLRFRADHTLGATTAAEAKANPGIAQDARATLLGDSSHAGIVAYIFWELLHQQGLLAGEPDVTVVATRIPDQAEVGQRGQHRHARPATAAHAGRWGTVTKEELMVAELIRRQTHRGGDIRSTGLLGCPTRWPRNHIPANWWSWNPVLDTKFSHEEHINALEMRSDLLALRWRLRVAGNVGTRAIHLMDSQVSLGALAHGRSPSAAVAPIIEKIGALTIGGSMVQHCAYTHTNDNPADAGSRK